MVLWSSRPTSAGLATFALLLLLGGSRERILMRYSRCMGVGSGGRVCLEPKTVGWGHRLPWRRDSSNHWARLKMRRCWLKRTGYTAVIRTSLCCSSYSLDACAGYRTRWIIVEAKLLDHHGKIFLSLPTKRRLILRQPPVNILQCDSWKCIRSDYSEFVACKQSWKHCWFTHCGIAYLVIPPVSNASSSQERFHVQP